MGFYFDDVLGKHRNAKLGTFGCKCCPSTAGGQSDTPKPPFCLKKKTTQSASVRIKVETSI